MFLSRKPPKGASVVPTGFVETAHPHQTMGGGVEGAHVITPQAGRLEDRESPAEAAQRLLGTPELKERHSFGHSSARLILPQIEPFERRQSAAGKRESLSSTLCEESPL